jgi:hypothetical protein
MIQEVMRQLLLRLNKTIEASQIILPRSVGASYNRTQAGMERVRVEIESVFGVPAVWMKRHATVGPPFKAQLTASQNRDSIADCLNDRGSLVRRFSSVPFSRLS